MAAESSKGADPKGAERGADLSQEIIKYTEMMAQDPKSRAFALLAEAYRKSGLHAEAVKVARGGLAIHPYYLSGRVALGRALFDGGNLDEARQEFEKVITSAPDNLMAHRHLARIYESQGRLGEAARFLKMVVLLDPRDSESRAKLMSISTTPGSKHDIGAGGGMDTMLEGHRYDDMARPARAEPAPRAAAQAPPPKAAPPPRTEPPPKPPSPLEDSEDIVFDLIEEEPPAPEPAKPAAAAPPPPPTRPAEPSASWLEAPSGPPASWLEAPPAPPPPPAPPAAEERWESVFGEVPAEAAPAAEAPAELSTETLADIYIQQGFYDKALAIYRQLLTERKEDARLKQKIGELESLLSVSRQPAPAAPIPPGPAAAVGTGGAARPAASEVLQTLRTWLKRIQTERK